MGKENAVYLKEFVITNPAGGDQLNTIDDHMRMTKSVLRTSFPDHSAPTVLIPITGGGTANAQTVALTTFLGSYVTNMLITWWPVAANTGAVTLSVNGLAAKTLTDWKEQPLRGGELQPTAPAQAYYDGVKFVLANGMLAPVLITSSSDISVIANGEYYWATSTPTGAPAANMLMRQFTLGTRILQVAFGTTDSELYIRSKISTSWEAWRKMSLWDGAQKFVSTLDPTSDDGVDGDFWFKLES